jgi:hypothetical protein
MTPCTVQLDGPMGTDLEKKWLAMKKCFLLDRQEQPRQDKKRINQGMAHVNCTP